MVELWLKLKLHGFLKDREQNYADESRVLINMEDGWSVYILKL